MDAAEKAKLDEVLRGLPPDLAARLAPVMGSGSMNELLPVLRHLHAQLGEFIKQMEEKEAKHDPSSDPGKGRQ